MMKLSIGKILWMFLIVIGYEWAFNSSLGWCDNCGDLRDCFGTVATATAVGVAAAAVIGLAILAAEGLGVIAAVAAAGEALAEAAGGAIVEGAAEAIAEGAAEAIAEGAAEAIAEGAAEAAGEGAAEAIAEGAVEAAGEGAVEAAAGEGIGEEAVNEIVKNAKGIKDAISSLNAAGASQQEVISALTQVINGSGRGVGAVVAGEGGSQIMTGVVSGANQPIVQVAANGVARFGFANVELVMQSSGRFVATVTNIMFP